MRKQYLLGANQDREIVFAEFEVTNRNGYPEFTASFNCVRPFKESECDLEEYYDNWIDCMDDKTKCDMYERYDCRPSELASILANECNDPRDAMDCSLYPEEIIIDGESWYFESSSCGQHDTRTEGMDEYVNKEAYDILHELWDKYHLKEATPECIEAVNKITEMLDEVDEEQWIIDYIKINY